MNNQKDDIQLAYLAGLFEGEGSACVSRTKRDNLRRGYHYRCQISVSMIDYEPVKMFHDYFGGVFYKREISCQSDMFTWVISGHAAGEVAKRIQPYILSLRKSQSLNCIIDFADTMAYSGGRITEDVFSTREMLYEKSKFYHNPKNALTSDFSYNYPILDGTQLSFF